MYIFNIQLHVLYHEELMKHFAQIENGPKTISTISIVSSYLSLAARAAGGLRAVGIYVKPFLIRLAVIAGSLSLSAEIDEGRRRERQQIANSRSHSSAKEKSNSSRATFVSALFLGATFGSEQ